MKKISLFFLFFFLNLTPVISQEKWTMYDKTNGFAPGKVYGTLIDSRKQLWFGTSKGVSVFENGKFTTWITGSDGLQEFRDGYGNRYIDETDAGIIRVSDERVDIVQVNNFKDNKFNYYYRTGHNEYKNGTWKFYPNLYENPPAGADMVFRDNLNQIWIIKKKEGLKLYHTNYEPITDLNNTAPKPPYTSVMADLEGVWVATKKEMYRFDNQKKTWVSYAHIKSLENVHDIYPINDMIMFSNLQEVTIFKDGEFKTFGKEYKMGAANCLGYYNDKVKNETWIVTSRDLIKYKNNELTLVYSNKSFRCTKKYLNGFVVASDKNLLFYNGEEFQLFKNPLVNVEFKLIEIFGKMWYTSGHYSIYLDGENAKEYWPDIYKKIRMPGLFLANDTLATKRNGDIFFYFKSVTREFNWIFKFNKNEEWSRIEIPNKNKFIALSIKDCIKDKNEIFLISTAVGLFKFNGEEIELVIPWDNGSRGNQLGWFIGDKWLVCSNEGVIYFPECAFSLLK